MGVFTDGLLYGGSRYRPLWPARSDDHQTICPQKHHMRSVCCSFLFVFVDLVPRIAQYVAIFRKSTQGKSGPDLLITFAVFWAWLSSRFFIQKIYFAEHFCINWTQTSIFCGLFNTIPVYIELGIKWYAVATTWHNFVVLFFPGVQTQVFSIKVTSIFRSLWPSQSHDWP